MCRMAWCYFNSKGCVNVRRNEKEGIVSFVGTVEDITRDIFRVRVHLNEKSDEKGSILVNCTQSGKIRKHQIVIIVGDVVDVEVSTHDFSRGRITFRRQS